jgi:hypothetical protein
VQGPGDLFVLGRGDARGGFHEMDRGAQAAPEVGHFQADGSGADDGQASRRVVEVQQVCGVQDAFVVGLHARKPVGGRPRGDDECGKGQLLCAFACDSDGPAVEQFRVASEQGHAVFFEGPGHGFVGSGDESGLAFFQGGHIHGNGPAAQSQARLGVEAFQGGGGPEVEFGGDAPPVEAGAAKAVPFREGDRFSSLTGEQSCGITARTCPYDNDVKMAHGSSRSGLRCCMKEAPLPNPKQGGTQPRGAPVRRAVCREYHIQTMRCRAKSRGSAEIR